MIRVMTLATGDLPDHATNKLQQGIAPTGPGTIDILCCQSIRRSLDGNEDLTDTLAQSFGLTCSCFAAHRLRLDEPPQPTGVSGLAIMVGGGVWMLNSGSFPVPGDQEGEERIVQFALVRKNGASLLILNLQLAAAKPAQRMQMHALFSHPLLKERYGAVVLCADRQTILSGKALQALTTRSDYILRSGGLQPAPSGPGNGMMCLLTAREQAATAVTIGSAAALPAAGLCACPPSGLTVEFEINRSAKDKNNRPYLPLSFREQWLGGRERYLAIAT